MLARKDQTKSPIFLPENWNKKVENVLLDVYGTECQRDSKSFNVIALTYPDELLMAVSYGDSEGLTIPVTYLVSVDLVNQKSPTETLDKLIDSIGIFFDSYFANPEWDDYSTRWLESEFKGVDFFYKITRENVVASLAADKMLADDELS